MRERRRDFSLRVGPEWEGRSYYSREREREKTDDLMCLGAIALMYVYPVSDPVIDYPGEYF